MLSQPPAHLLPPPEKVQKLLLWHRGALGDLLLSWPALKALKSRYAEAGMVAVGQPQIWELLAASLSLGEIINDDWSMWAWLFTEEGPIPEELMARLGSVQLAVVFTPRPNHTLLNRLSRAGSRAGCRRGRGSAFPAPSRCVSTHQERTPCVIRPSPSPSFP